MANTYKEAKKRIAELTAKLHERIGVNGEWYEAENNAYRFFRYDEHTTWEKANPEEAKPLREELETLKATWAKEIAEDDAKDTARAKRAKAKRYTKELAELEDRMNYLKRWLAEYEKEEV